MIFRSILRLALCLLLPGALLAQEVFETAESTYSTRKLIHKMDIGATNRLLIRAAANLPGSLLVKTSGTKEVSVTYYKKAKAETKEQAIDFIDLIAIVLDRTPEALRLEMRAPNPAPWKGDTEWGMVEAEISV